MLVIGIGFVVLGFCIGVVVVIGVGVFLGWVGLIVCILIMLVLVG